MMECTLVKLFPSSTLGPSQKLPPPFRGIIGPWGIRYTWPGINLPVVFHIIQINVCPVITFNTAHVWTTHATASTRVVLMLWPEEIEREKRGKLVDGTIADDGVIKWKAIRRKSSPPGPFVCGSPCLLMHQLINMSRRFDWPRRIEGTEVRSTCRYSSHRQFVKIEFCLLPQPERMVQFRQTDGQSHVWWSFKIPEWSNRGSRSLALVEQYRNACTLSCKTHRDMAAEFCCAFTWSTGTGKRKGLVFLKSENVGQNVEKKCGEGSG